MVPLIVINCNRSRISCTVSEIAFDGSTSLYLATTLVFNPRREDFPGTNSVKFCMEITGWLRYKMA